MTDVNEFKTDEVNKIDIAYQDATVKILPTAGDKIIMEETKASAKATTAGSPMGRPF